MVILAMLLSVVVIMMLVTMVAIYAAVTEAEQSSNLLGECLLPCSSSFVLFSLL